MKPVKHPDVKPGDDARKKLAETSVALTVANKRIEAAKRWYDGIRSEALRGK